MEKLRYGLVGAGHQGTIVKSGRHVVALCDINPATMYKLADSMGVSHDRCYGDPYDLLDQEELDVLIVATPPHNREVVADALVRGLHVFCENPLAVDFKQARSIVKTARQTGKVCTVNDQWPLLAGVQVAARLVVEGKIGELRRVVVSGKGRHALNQEIPRIGSHLFGVAIHHWTGPVVTCRGMRFKSGADVVGVFTTKNGIPLVAEFWSQEYDVGRCFVRLEGNQGQVLAMGGFLENVYHMARPYLSTGEASTEPGQSGWQQVPVPDVWTIRHGDEEKALGDQTMNRTFWMLDQFEQAIQKKGENPWPADRALLAVEAMDMLFQKSW